MLYWKIIAVCSQIHAKHIDELCVQNIEFIDAKLAVRVIKTGLNLSYKEVSYCCIGK
jgi:hypothetical protein